MKDIILRNQVYLERLKAGYMTDYAKLIEEVGQDITALLSSLESETLSELSRTKQKALLRELRGIQRAAYTGEGDKLLEELEDLTSFSIEVEDQVKYYHGTSKENAAKIRKEGFKTGQEKRGGKFVGDGVYITPNKIIANNFGEEIIEVVVGKDKTIRATKAQYRKILEAVDYDTDKIPGYLRSKGYDLFDATPLGEGYGILVLDPENVVVSSAGTAAGTTLAAANAVVNQSPIQGVGELLEPFVKDLSAREIKRVEREILNSTAQGRTIRQTVNAIVGTKSKNYKDGVLDKNLNDAKTVVRTATQHVSTQSRVALMEVNDLEEYEWVSTLDSRTSPQCRSLDGQTFELGKGPLPPIHPNCRSTIVPADVDEGATRSSIDGPVNANLSYYEWLKTQDQSFQDDVLGPTRGKLFRDGGLSAKKFGELQLDKKFEPITLDEMKKKQPNAFKKAKI